MQPQPVPNQSYGHYPTHGNPQSVPSEDVHPVICHAQYPRTTLKRAAGLKALCVCELLFALWSIILGESFWTFLLVIPVDIIGFFGAHRLRKNTLTAFSFLKSLMLGLLLLYFADVVTSWVSCAGYCGSANVPVLSVMMILILAFQILCMYLSVKIRQDILLAERASVPSVELHSFVESQPQQPQQPLQHFQDPNAAATAGVPGYPPYLPQFYPAMYMNQGYPMSYATPYPHAMHAPVATFPSFTISDEQQQQQQQQPQTTDVQQPLLQEHNLL
jgi:hypothetical protein